MTTIKLKNGSGAPTAGDLVQGEPALDLTNKRLYTEDSGGTVIEVGTNPGTDVTFADDRKAVFGAGSDLEIYHESSTGRSFIKETGADEFRILGSNIRIKNGGDSKTYMQMTDGGSVAIRHNDATKLETTSTGIDVTGGIAATDDSTFTAASGDIYVTASTPTGAARSGFRVDETANNGFEMAHDNADNAFFISRRSGSSTVVDALKIDRSTGDFSLFEDTGTTAKLFWDASAESLGIGTSSPDGILDIEGNFEANKALVLTNTQGTGKVSYLRSHGGNGETLALYHDGSRRQIWDSSGYTSFENGGSEAMRIDSSGNVLVGTTDSSIETSSSTEGVNILPDKINVARSAGVTANFNRISTDGNIVQFRKDGTTVGSISTFGGNLQISPNTTFGVDAPSDIFLDSAGVTTFKTNGTENARIDSSGNLLVGKTSDDNTTTGMVVGGNGFTKIVRTSGTANVNTVLSLNRLVTDGEILRLQKDGTNVGSISVLSNRLYIGSGDTGIKFSGADDLISPIDASDGTGRDAAIDLGSSSARFKDLYLSGGAYLGGTGSANLLDDYEEGTFTITLRDATSGGNTSSTTANGSYTKVGRLVTCSLNGALSNIDTTGMTGANTLYMDLPFTKDVTVEDLGVMVYDSLDTGSLNASIQNVVPETVSGSSNVLQFRTYGDNIGDNLLKVQDITSGTTDFIRLTITYQAA